jgi:putative transposase
MWGADGAKVFTVEEGWGRLLVALEHWNMSVNRGPDLRPWSQFLKVCWRATAGSVAAAAGRGLSLRMGHGTQYLSNHFRKQIKHWGINASFAFIEQPQTNGVAERFIRTLKEHVIYGRVFQNLQDVRETVRGFVDTYNREWLVEKNGFLSRWQARSQWLAQNSIARAT